MRGSQCRHFILRCQVASNYFSQIVHTIFILMKFLIVDANLFPLTVSGMYYWSNEKVDAIVQSTSTKDTVLRLLPKGTYAVCAYTVSATSYALLSYLENGGSASSLHPQVDPIQKFLQEQHMWVGGFSSSQVWSSLLLDRV